jgi:hypothetical protein
LEINIIGKREKKQFENGDGLFIKGSLKPLRFLQNGMGGSIIS